MSRKVKGSQNRHKARLKVARLHARISAIRQDGLHQLTTSLTRRFHTIGIEDLNVKGMVQNRHKARLKVARLHARIRAIRQDGLHQLTTSLTRRFHTIGIEDLNVQSMVKKDMVKNRHLARALADMGFFEFRRQLDYKARQRGAIVVVADKWFPSSKTCSQCAHKLETLLFYPRWSGLALAATADTTGT